ncbi:MAG: tetratricopeptide repeat protein [Leptolyngbya sp. Prado105]|jgi:predicted O-linked N-acetylglucosamine transferase (SPINDLY family)|nr:tetratricopeptide repeat protein [Leptolyngbya sp. Prado105]
MTMTPVPSVDISTSWQQQAHEYLIQGRYDRAATLYEQAIESEPDIKSYYWHYGLLLLLQGEEAEAQTTWLFALSEVDPDQVEQCNVELIQVLQTEAERREFLRDYSMAWAIRQHIREIAADDINNLWHLVKLSIEIGLFTSNIFEEIGLIQQIQVERPQFDPVLALKVIEQILGQFLPSSEILNLIEACKTKISPPKAWHDVIIPAAFRLGYDLRKPKEAAGLLEIVLTIQDEPDLLGDLAMFYQNDNDYDRGIAAAKRRLEVMDSLPDKIFSSHLLLRGLLGAGGLWEEAIAASEQHFDLLQALIDQQPTDIHPGRVRRLFNSGYHLVYFKDQPEKWRSLQNQLMDFCQRNMQLEVAEQVKKFQFTERVQAWQKNPTRPLRIGYLSHCMAFHSVGWLARWLFKHHKHDHFEIYGYFINYKEEFDPVQDMFSDNVDHVRKITSSMHGIDIANLIYQDEIDILIDLDSITLDLTCQVFALKPAPIQATWLGWDASGIPAIDYFIADPYVLPESADSYYSEKIWRLPETYIAVDGFEVDAPTLRREDFSIPDDAVIFLTAQRGYKRHRDTAKMQMQIIKEVPNSYLLIKGFADEKSVQNFFLEIADEVGVAHDRLRFPKTDPLVPAHRANLALADIVLDTFPYNGATTTLETLWREIPIVTRVGEQFAARNSYGMMMNVGVTEGIAFSDREYIEWGVRLGTDAALRQSVVSKLHQSKRSAPLWNGKQFAREMEQAYKQMWAIYTES